MASVTRFRHFLNKNWVLDTVFRSQYPRAPGKAQKRRGKPKSAGERPKAPGKGQKRREETKSHRHAKKAPAGRLCICKWFQKLSRHLLRFIQSAEFHIHGQ